MLGRALPVALASLVFPGLGHGMRGRRAQTIVWALLGLLPVIGILVSISVLYLALVVRVICAIDTFRISWIDDPAVTWLTLLSGIALGSGAILIAFMQLALQSFKIPSSSMNPTLAIGD